MGSSDGMKRQLMWRARVGDATALSLLKPRHFEACVKEP
jgi:hypothetical protein